MGGSIGHPGSSGGDGRINLPNVPKKQTHKGNEPTPNPSNTQSGVFGDPSTDFQERPIKPEGGGGGGGQPFASVGWTQRSYQALRNVFRAFTSGNFRSNLIRLTGISPTNADAHHVFPQTNEFSSFFSSRGINVHDPQYGTWWQSNLHREYAWEYNNSWRSFIQQNPNATKDQVLQYGRTLMNSYGFKVQF